MALIKRLKNISGNTLQILNRDIAHNSYYEIPEQLWWELANDASTSAAVSAGQIIVNDGSQDLTIDDALRLIKRYQDVEALDVSYDNSDSGLSAETAQDAIDELHETLTDRPGAPVTCGFDGGASSGRWLEFSGNVGADDAGFVVPAAGKLTHLSVAVENNTTCTFTVYKNGSSVATLSLSSARKGSNTQNVSLAANDELTVKVTSGSGSRPVFNLFVRIG